MVDTDSLHHLHTNGGSGGVRSVQVKGPNSGWTGLKNIWGGAWEIANQPQLPLDLHVTADSGQEVLALSSEPASHTHPNSMSSRI